MRLAALITHPIQYYTPLFRELARKIDLTVFFAHAASADDHRNSGFGVGFDWDIDLLSGYRHTFLENVSKKPSLNSFNGVDTPQIVSLLRSGGFDALLLTGWYRKSHLQALAAAKRMGLPVIVRGDSHLDTPRGAVKRAAQRALYPHFLRLFDAALIVGMRNRAYWEYYGYPRARMFSSPHCVDNNFFAERATLEAGLALRERLGIALEEKIVLFAGKMVPFKRPLDVVDSVSKVRRGGIRASMVVAGSGPLEHETRARADLLGVPLQILGFQNQTQMPAVYAASDIVALPSDGRETWGLVCNEALACGRGIVVSDQVGCAPDLAADGLIGRTFPMGNIDAFADSLAKSLSAPALPQAIYSLSDRFSLRAAADGVLEGLQAVKKPSSQRNGSRA